MREPTEEPVRSWDGLREDAAATYSWAERRIQELRNTIEQSSKEIEQLEDQRRRLDGAFELVSRETFEHGAIRVTAGGRRP